MGGFSLWPHEEVFSHALPMSFDRFDSPSDRFAIAWMDRFGAYDYGALTVWLMRGFGLPNLRSHNPFKHSFSWGVDTQDGYAIAIEPKLLRIERSEWEHARLETNPEEETQKALLQRLQFSKVFTVYRVTEGAVDLTPGLFNKWLEQFARPIYVHDVGASVIGPLEFGEHDVGPSHPSVLSAGAQASERPGPPKPRG